MEPYLGDIRMFGGPRAPTGWLFCQGQLLDINQYRDLYNVIGTAFGGDGTTNFALPDVQGRLPVHRGGEYRVGQRAGSETVSFQVANIPSHTHLVRASANPGTSGSPVNNILAKNGGGTAALYYEGSPTDAMNQNMINPSTGTGSAHDNLQPFLCVNFIICSQGQYPPRPTTERVGKDHG